MTVQKQDKRARKRSVPLPIRRQLAIRYGYKEGQENKVKCHFCTNTGTIHWMKLYNGKLCSWVTFGGLEIDHLIPESKGGTENIDNLVLSCQSCNHKRNNKEVSIFSFKWV